VIVDGDTVHEGSGTAGTTHTTPGGITIGAFAGGSNPSPIDIGEVLVIPSAVSSTNRQLVETYMRTRWATP